MNLLLLDCPSDFTKIVGTLYGIQAWSMQQVSNLKYSLFEFETWFSLNLWHVSPLPTQQIEKMVLLNNEEVIKIVRINKIIWNLIEMIDFSTISFQFLTQLTLLTSRAKNDSSFTVTFKRCKTPNLCLHHVFLELNKTSFDYFSCRRWPW